jgi:hypothetical protein
MKKSPAEDKETGSGSEINEEGEEDLSFLKRDRFVTSSDQPMPVNYVYAFFGPNRYFFFDQKL